MAFDKTTDFVSLIRKVGTAYSQKRMPPIDFLVIGLAEAGFITLVSSVTEPVANQSSTAWLDPASPSYGANGAVKLWNGTAYVIATPALFQVFMTSLIDYTIPSGSGAPVAAPTSNTLYADTDTTPNTLYYWYGAAWTLLIEATTAASVADKTALRAVDTAETTSIYLANEDMFDWDSSDLSSKLVVKTETTTTVAGNICTVANTDLYTKEAVRVTSAVNGLALNTVYFIIRLGTNTFSLAATLADAIAGTAITLTGTTNFTAERLKDYTQGVFVIKTGAELNGSGGAWKRRDKFITPYMFGADPSLLANDNYPGIQAAVDFGEPFWMHRNRHTFTETIHVDDDTEIFMLGGEHSTLRYAVASPMDMIAGRKAGGGATSERNYRFKMHGGMMESNYPGTRYGTAFNFESMTDARLWGVRGTYLLDGVVQGGATSHGAFYNEFHGCILTSLDGAGYRNGLLANDAKVIGGKVIDMLVGAEDDDTSGNIYDDVTFETFTAFGTRNGNTGAAGSTKYTNCRFEVPNDGAYAGAVAQQIGATSENTLLSGAQWIMPVGTSINDLSGSTTAIGCSDGFGVPYHKFGGGQAFRSKHHKTVTQAVASLAAGAVRQDVFSVPDAAIGDTITVTPPSTMPNGLLAISAIPSTGQVYVQMHNPTGGALDLAIAAPWQFEITKWA